LHLQHAAYRDFNQRHLRRPPDPKEARSVGSC
jgi:hypothetical protein